jgi:antitoxin HicB
MLKYPVILEPGAKGTILVSFPDVPGALTYGQDEEEALARAVDALETMFIAMIEDREPIPVPSVLKRGRRFVVVPPLTEAKIELYRAMRAHRVRKTELARRMNCHLPQIDRLLDLKHASRFEQLEAALRTVGKQITIEVRDAA